MQTCRQEDLSEEPEEADWHEENEEFLREVENRWGIENERVHAADDDLVSSNFSNSVSAEKEKE